MTLSDERLRTITSAWADVSDLCASDYWELHRPLVRAVAREACRAGQEEMRELLTDARECLHDCHRGDFGVTDAAWQTRIAMTVERLDKAIARIGNEGIDDDV